MSANNTNSKAETVNNNTIIPWIFIQVLEGRHYIGCDVMYKVKDLEKNETHVRSVTIDPDVEEMAESDLVFDTFEEALLRVFLTDENLKQFILGDTEVMSRDEFSRRLDAFCTCHWVSDDRIIFARGE